MFGLSLPEIFVILIVALLVIGPDKLPEVARGLGKGVRQLQRLANEVRDSIRLDDVATSHRPPAPAAPPAPPAPTASSEEIPPRAEGTPPT